MSTVEPSPVSVCLVTEETFVRQVGFIPSSSSSSSWSHTHAPARVPDLELCELGWDKFQGFCYRHFSSRQSWDAAEQHCRTCGGHLLSVMTPEEQQHVNGQPSPTFTSHFVYARFSNVCRPFSGKYREYQWIGLNDRTIEGDFRWSDGSPLVRSLPLHS